MEGVGGDSDRLINRKAKGPTALCFDADISDVIHQEFLQATVCEQTQDSPH